METTIKAPLQTPSSIVKPSKSDSKLAENICSAKSPLSALSQQVLIADRNSGRGNVRLSKRIRRTIPQPNRVFPAVQSAWAVNPTVGEGAMGHKTLKSKERDTAQSSACK
jgi:hypothetical protein